MNVVKLLRDAIRTYYRSRTIKAPPDIEKREFGVGGYGRKIEKRHMQFRSEQELNRYLSSEAPFYISYSVGKFKYPSAQPMDSKILESSDLVFEFDVDDLNIKSEKDVWMCEVCGSKGFGHVEKCPDCGSPVKIIYFPDKKREKVLKEKVKNLIDDILVGDFEIAYEDISINFSGNRGYHIHVRSDTYSHLSKEERIEVTEYVTGQAINVNYLFDRERTNCYGELKYINCLKGPKPGEGGWPGRIARAVIMYLSSMEKEDMDVDIDEKVKDILYINRERYIRSIEKGYWPVTTIIKEDVWLSIAKEVLNISHYMIDAATSSDIHRLIRLPDSIHGTTGMSAATVNDIDGFDPYMDAVVLSGRYHVRVTVKISPEFSIGGKEFGPYEDETVELPLYAAYYLIGKGVAEWT